MVTSSNGSFFSALLALCVGNSLVTGEFPSQRTSNAGFDVFLCGSAETVKQTIEWPVIWDSITFIWHHRDDIRKIPTYPWENKTSPSGDILTSAKSGSSANVTCSAVVKKVSGTQMVLPARPSNMRFSSPSCASCSSLQECLRYMRKDVVCQKHMQNRNLICALLSAAVSQTVLWFVNGWFYQYPRNGDVFVPKKIITGCSGSWQFSSDCISVSVIIQYYFTDNVGSTYCPSEKESHWKIKNR